MLSLIARNDPTVARREDFVRPHSPGTSDYLYQRPTSQEQRLPQSITASKLPSQTLKKALSELQFNTPKTTSQD